MAHVHPDAAVSSFSDQFKLLDDSTINIDPNGDTILVVHQDDESKTFRVSSQVMRLASPHWRKMLDVEYGFKESTTGSISLHEDNMQAVFLVLLASHLRFQDIPENLTFTELYELCVTCDKYFCIGVMRPWIYGWISPWKKTFDAYAQWAKISWVVGDQDEFGYTVTYLIKTCKTNEGKQCLDVFDQTIDEVLPPGLSDAILKARYTSLVALIQSCHSTVDRYGYSEGVSNCKSDEHEDECDALIYGHLLRQLQKLALWPGKPEDIADAMTTGSVEDLYSNVNNIESYTYPDFFHRKCGCDTQLHDEAEELVNGAGSELIESYGKQLDTRRKELSSKMDLTKFQT